MNSRAANLLVGQTVQGSSKAVHSSGKAQVGVRERRADQVSCVGADVASLVVAEQ